MSDPEERALEALDRGDYDETLEILMDAYGTRIYGFCRKMVNRRDDAEDVLQITFLNAYQALDRFERRATFLSWLFAIARNRCLDNIRKRLKERSTISDQELDVLPAEGGERDLHRSILSATLDDQLQRLSPKERSALLLRFKEGFTYPEMAAICHERPATLERRVARALIKLQRALGRGGDR